MFKKKTLRINTYLGYGTNTRFRASGRALEDENIDFSTNQGTLKTLRNIYRQFESDEVRNIPIILTLPNGKTIETQTDSEGYYNFEIDTTSIFPEQKEENEWISYQVSYKKEIMKKEISNDNIFSSKMFIPSKKAEFAVISDIDDTILHTGVASFFKWRVIANTIFKNFDKRKAIGGTVRFYKKLRLGKNNAINPIFYVSNSPWNLYDYLSAFLKKNNFPKGPILLRDFRTPFDKTPKPKIPHKQSEILNLLAIYPKLKFVLIGDSGEKDADIYTHIARQFPDRILAIYLRNVKHLKKEKRIQKIIQSFDIAPILLVHNAEEAMQHAKEIQLIN